MRWYIARRLLWALVVSYIIMSATWGLMVASPNPGAQALETKVAMQGGNATMAKQAYERSHGLDKPLWVRYKNYMVNMLTLHWGWSDSTSQPVTTAIENALPYTAIYSVPSVLFSAIVAVWIGIYSAVNRYTTTDYVATLFGFFGLAIPNFWFAIILLLVFGVELNWFPVVFSPDVGFFSVGMAKQLVLPVVVLVTGSIAGQMRYSRAQVLEQVQAEYVKTARAKGASERRVLYLHIFRVAAVPLMTIFVADLLGLFLSASYLVEVVFQIPGLGQLSYLALTTQDTALVLATTLIFTFVAVGGNLLQDIAYTVFDPRIDYGDR